MVFANIISQVSSDLHHSAVNRLNREEKYLQQAVGTEATVSHQHVEMRSGVAFTFDDSCKTTRLVPLNLDIIFLTASPQWKASGTYSFVHHHKHSENTPRRHKATVRLIIFKESGDFRYLQDQT